MRDFLRASNDADLVERADFGAQTAVYTEDFTVDYGSKDEEVEYLAAAFPDRCIAVLLLAFFVETVHLGDLA